MAKKIFNLIPDWLKIVFYKATGSKPWSRGYNTFKFSQIKKVIDNKEIRDRFLNLKPLPQGYGYGLDERIVEYPWFLTRIPKNEGKLLDAGSALNFRIILENPALKNKEITIVNLNPEEDCFWQKGVSYIFSDVRKSLFKDNYFDYISCISTLEHIGMDNTIYTKDNKYQEKNIYAFERAVVELKRVLKPGGKIFITVPFGKYQDLGFFQQFDSNLINKIIENFQPSKKEIVFYKYTKDGWNLSSENNCKDCQFFDILNHKKFDSDFAAASRAVACLELIKN